MAMTFNTASGATIDREKLVLYMNTGTAQSPTWSPIGKRVEDSSAEYDWQKETKKDILGATRITMKKPIITQTFEPCELDAGDAALVKIFENAIVNQDQAALTNMDLLLVHLYYSENVGTGEVVVHYFAERYPESAISVTSLGGAGGGNIGAPIECTFGGERATGYVVKSGSTITFTADA